MNTIQLTTNKSKHITPSVIYLATSNSEKLYPLNSIDPSSVEYTEKCNDISTITFDMHAFTTTPGGKRIRGAGYDVISKYMRLYVTGVGWFICQTPVAHHTNEREYKTIEAQSAQIEYSQIRLDQWKVNRGTTDSLEMLIDSNVEKINDVEFAKENIVFYNPANPSLSLIDILVSKVHGWKVGYIDSIPKIYEEIKNGKTIKKSVLLADEIGTFDIDNSNAYAFMTQDMEKHFKCIIDFDFDNMLVNFYRVENYGKETDITIGFRNVENSNDVTVDEDNIFTQFIVHGGDGLGIEQVNGGTNELIYLDEYWLNQKYLSAGAVSKYKQWDDFCKDARYEYAVYSRRWNHLQEIISELTYRMPLSDCDPVQWQNLEDQELQSLKADYTAQKYGYEKMYSDDEGNFNYNMLLESPDAYKYEQIVHTILPNIEIEMNNRELSSSIENTEYLKDFETIWKYYGLHELNIRLQSYRDIQNVLRKDHYDITYDEYAQLSKQNNTDYPPVTYDGFQKKHKEYQKAIKQLNSNHADSCASAYKQREAEIENAKKEQDAIRQKRTDLAQAMNIRTWNTPNGFTEDELAELSHILNPTDYTNENIFIASTDQLADTVDVQQRLLQTALDDIAMYSAPQYTYTTTLDNLLVLLKGKNDFKIHPGDFIKLEVSPDHFVKLRMTSITLNPCVYDNKFLITFSNMIRTRRGTDDFISLLDLSGNINKRNLNSSRNDTRITDDTVYDLLKKILQSRSFGNKVEQIINNSQNLALNYLQAKDIYADNAFIEYVQSQLITANKIVAENADFKSLKTIVGMLDNLISGTVSSELGHIIKLTAENVAIDEAVIRDLIASQITVSMLQAGSISSDSFHIESNDGGFAIVGNTMTFRDNNGNTRIQIGRDAKNNFTFVLYDETGTGILMDSNGIHKSAIADGLIVNTMIAKGTISRDRLGFKTVETDENGKVSITEILDPNGKSLGESYKEIQKTVEKMQSDISSAGNYTIVMGREFQIIPCTDDRAVEKMTIEIPFCCYKNLNKIGVKATTGLLPSGMVLLENTDSTATQDGIIKFSIQKNAVIGEIGMTTGTIPITFHINDQLITKDFTWAKLSSGKTEFRFLEIVPLIVTRCDNVLSPQSINIFVRNRNERGNIVTDAGKIQIIEIDENGKDTIKYQSETDESHTTHTISSPNVKYICCRLYAKTFSEAYIDEKVTYVISDTAGLEKDITRINTKMTEVTSTLDKQEKRISEKVSSSDVTQLIHQYDNSTVKMLRDTISSHETSLSGITQSVSDVQSSLSKKANSETVQSLSRRTSTLEQDAGAFKQTVAATYATKNDVDKTSQSLKSQITQTESEINQRITNYTNNMNTQLKQTEDSIRMSVNRKQDVLPTRIRFIRDWLNTNQVDAEKRWENISILVNDTNVASGERNIAKEKSTRFTTDISDLTDLKKYSDDTSSSYISALTSGWHYIQTDVGDDNAFDSGQITIYHDTQGKRIYDTKLEVSADGKNWYCLFDSNQSGRYQETAQGKTYFISADSIQQSISFLETSLDSITERVEKNASNYAELTTGLRQIHGRVADTENSVQSIINEEIPKLDKHLTERIGELTVQSDSVSADVKKLDGELQRHAKAILNIDEWKVSLANIGGYDSKYATQKVSMKLTSDGLSIQRSETDGYVTKISGDTIQIQYDNGRGHTQDSMRIERDLMYLSRVHVSNGVDHGTIKEVPITYNVKGKNIGCLIFVAGSNNI